MRSPQFPSIKCYGIGHDLYGHNLLHDAELSETTSGLQYFGPSIKSTIDLRGLSSVKIHSRKYYVRKHGVFYRFYINVDVKMFSGIDLDSLQLECICVIGILQ